jgi:predicted permease
MFLELAGTADIGSTLASALSSVALWTAIAKIFIFVLLGFALTKLKAFPEGMDKLLTKVVMLVALPCLAFTSFMTDFSATAGLDALVNFILGFVLYLLFIYLSKGIFFWVKEPEKKKILCVIFTFGLTTFLSQPLIYAIFGNLAYNDSNMLNVAYRVFLYSYAYVVVSGMKIGATKETSFKATAQKILLNPILIATMAGLLLWVLQALPGAASAHWWTVRTDWLSGNTANTFVPLWRFDVTLPWLNSAASILGGLASPLVMIAIGCTLGSVPFLEAARDKLAWIYSGLKVFLAPAIVLGILYGLEAIVKEADRPEIISLATVQSAVLMWMVPPATSAVAYCISFDKEKVLASDASFISTIVAIPGIIFWVLILTLIASSHFFYAAV